jgi:AcrR family transcriptional regulator
MTTDDARTRILNAAGPIFAEKGFAAATVREICQAADVNVASVNYYFGGKEALYIEAVAQAHPGKLGPGAFLDWPDGTPPERKLKDFLCMMLTRLLSVQSASWQEELFMREVLNPSPMCREMLRERFRAAFDQLQRILDEIVVPETPPHQRHQIGFSVIGQCVYYRTGRNVVPLIVGEEELASHYGIDQLADHIWRVTLAALGLGPPLGRPLLGESDGCGPPEGCIDPAAYRTDGGGKARRQQNGRT